MLADHCIAATGVNEGDVGANRLTNFLRCRPPPIVRYGRHAGTSGTRCGVDGTRTTVAGRHLPRTRALHLALAARPRPAGHPRDGGASAVVRPSIRLRVAPLRRQPDLATSRLEGRGEIGYHAVPLTDIPR